MAEVTSKMNQTMASSGTEPLYYVQHSISTLITSTLLGRHALTNIIIALVTLLAYTYYRALPKPIPGIPYSEKSRWRLFGDALDFVQYSKETGEGFRWFATKAAELNSPIFQIFLGPFAKPAIVVADIQELVDMASRRSRYFDRGGFVTTWLGILFPQSTISMPSHDRFKLQRSTWAPTMTGEFLNTISARTIHRHTLSLVKLWEKKARQAQGKPFDVTDDVKQVTFDMIWTAATGDDLGVTTRRENALTSSLAGTASTKTDIDTAIEFKQPEDLPEIVHACDTLVEHLKDIRASPWMAVTKFRLNYLSRSWAWAWRCKEETVENLIASSRARFASRKASETREATCAMDEVFRREALAEARGRSITRREMIDETLTYIFGGHETMQDTTRWSLKYLTTNPVAQAKLHAALLETFPGSSAHNLPSYSEIVAREHPYVEATMQELFRISLTAPSMTRRATCDTSILGYAIPAGTDIFGAPSVESLEDMDPFAIDAATRSPSSKARVRGQWARGDKGEYVPERWIDGQGKFDPYAGPMLPFGAGTRGCFGQKLARLELRMIVIMLVLSFEFVAVPEQYNSFRAEEVINRGPSMTFIRPVLRPT